MSIPAHDEEEAEELVYDYLDLSMGPDSIEIDYGAELIDCPDCDEDYEEDD